MSFIKGAIAFNSFFVVLLALSSDSIAQTQPAVSRVYETGLEVLNRDDVLDLDVYYGYQASGGHLVLELSDQSKMTVSLVGTSPADTHPDPFVFNDVPLTYEQLDNDAVVYSAETVHSLGDGLPLKTRVEVTDFSNSRTPGFYSHQIEVKILKNILINGQWFELVNIVLWGKKLNRVVPY